MSLLGRTGKQLARVGDPLEIRLRNLVRRFTVTATKGALWKLLGVRGLADEETGTAEVFHGIGIAARPPVDGQPEAIVVNVGGAKAPVIVATRDLKTLQAVLADMGELEAGSTLVHTEACVIYARPNGTVEIRTPAGTATKLPTLADVQALVDAFNGHRHTSAASGSPTSGPKDETGAVDESAPNPTGTVVLKAE
jgi:phage gp45-like